MPDLASPFSVNVDRPLGLQRVAPYEANLIAQANQKRLAISKQALPQLEALRTQINRLDHALREQASELAAAWGQVKALDARVYSPPMKPALYTILIGTLVLLETPVNAAALDFLRLPQVETYGAAFSFGLINAWAAKSTARVLRQKGWADRPWRDWGITVLANGGLLVAVVAMAKLRSLQAGQDLAALSFFALQIAFYLAALFCGFLQLDPSPLAEQLGKRIASHRVALDAAWSSRARLASAHNQALATAHIGIDALVQDALERIFQYRDANMLHRGGTERPPTWFGQSVPFAAFVPIHLGVLVDEHPDSIGVVVGFSKN